MKPGKLLLIAYALAWGFALFLPLATREGFASIPALVLGMPWSFLLVESLFNRPPSMIEVLAVYAFGGITFFLLLMIKGARAYLDEWRNRKRDS